MNLAQKVARNRRNILSREDKNSILTISNQIVWLETSDLNDIIWVGDATIKNLLDNNIRTQEDLKSKSEEEIKKLKLNVLSEKRSDMCVVYELSEVGKSDKKNNNQSADKQYFSS